MLTILWLALVSGLDLPHEKVENYKHKRQNDNYVLNDKPVTWAIYIPPENENLLSFLYSTKDAHHIVEEMGLVYVGPLEIGTIKGYHIVKEPIQEADNVHLQKRLDLRKRNIDILENKLLSNPQISWVSRQNPKKRERRTINSELARSILQDKTIPNMNDPLIINGDSWFLVN